MMVKAAKKQLRQQILEKMLKVSPDQRDQATESMMKAVMNLSPFKTAQTIGIFISMPSEISTLGLIRESLILGKRVFVPRVTTTKEMTMLEIYKHDDIAAFPRTKWGIPEPEPRRRAVLETDVDGGADLIVVPGVAFDANFDRLGHGAGFYDRYLGQMIQKQEREGKQRVYMVAVGLRCQMLQEGEKVPTHEADVRMDCVVVA